MLKYAPKLPICDFLGSNLGQVTAMFLLQRRRQLCPFESLKIIAIKRLHDEDKIQYNTMSIYRPIFKLPEVDHAKNYPHIEFCCKKSWFPKCVTNSEYNDDALHTTKKSKVYLTWQPSALVPPSKLMISLRQVTTNAADVSFSTSPVNVVWTQGSSTNILRAVSALPAKTSLRRAVAAGSSCPGLAPTHRNRLPMALGDCNCTALAQVSSDTNLKSSKVFLSQAEMNDATRSFCWSLWWSGNEPSLEGSFSVTPLLFDSSLSLLSTITGSQFKCSANSAE